MIKLLIFDLDGTLVDAFKAVSQSLNHVMDELGCPRQPHHVVKRAVGWGEGDLLTTFVGEKRRRKALQLFRRHHREALFNGGARFLKGTKRTIKWAHREGFELAIASNRPHMYTRLILKGLEIDQLFKYVVCADRVDRPKPHPDMLKEILQRSSFKPSEALFIGDMTVDAIAGRRAKIKTVCITTGVSTEEEIVSEKPFKVIHQMQELTSVIESL